MSDSHQEPTPIRPRLLGDRGVDAGRGTDESADAPPATTLDRLLEAVEILAPAGVRVSVRLPRPRVAMQGPALTRPAGPEAPFTIPRQIGLEAAARRRIDTARFDLVSRPIHAVTRRANGRDHQVRVPRRGIGGAAAASIEVDQVTIATRLREAVSSLTTVGHTVSVRSRGPRARGSLRVVPDAAEGVTDETGARRHVVASGNRNASTGGDHPDAVAGHPLVERLGMGDAAGLILAAIHAQPPVGTNVVRPRSGRHLRVVET